MSKIIPVSIVIPLGRVSEQCFSLYMRKRVGTDHLEGALEFPGGKIEAGEAPIEAACREVTEETLLNLENSKLELIKVYRHDYKERSVTLFSYLYQLNQNESEHLVSKDFESFSFDYGKSNWENLMIPEANKLIISDLSQYIERHVRENTWEKLWAMS